MSRRDSLLALVFVLALATAGAAPERGPSQGLGLEMNPNGLAQGLGLEMNPNG